MAPIDWGVLSRLVPEIALVLVFMWYTRERDKAYVAAQKERDAEWRAFLSEERQARTDSAARLGEEIKDVAQLMASTQALLVQHDSYTRMVGAQLTGQPRGGPTVAGG